MNSARAVIEELVYEAAAPARVMAIIYGPEMPANGGYVLGNSDTSVINKIRGHLTDKGAASRDDPDLLSAWVFRGYSILVRNEKGQMVFYGAETISLDRQAIDLFGLTPGTVVFWFSQPTKDRAYPLHGQRITGSALGVS